MIEFSALSSNLGLEIVFRTVMSILRYLIFAGTAFFIFYVWKYRSWFVHKIQQKMPSKKELRHELMWSLLSRVLLAFIFIGILSVLGYSKVYFEVSEYGVAYLLATSVGLILIHDTYFYWIHWLMHRPKLYRHIHKVHHHSVNPTPLAAFSFHPTEALLEVGILPIVLFLIPLHPIALGFMVFFQLAFNVYGHSGFELMPRWWVANPITKYFNTSTHHNLHHKEFHYNYGLYFNHWDRWMGTLEPDYETKFYAIKDRKKKEASSLATS